MSTRSLCLTRLLVVAAVGLAATVVGGASAGAVGAPVALGTAASYAVLGGSTVTNTGPTTLTGDLGLSPGTSITGFPPGHASGATHAADAAAAQAQLDTTTAYNDAAGRGPGTVVAADLGGQTLVSGVYSGGALGLTGTLTLDGQNDASSVFVLQAASTLTTASNSSVVLIRGASPCNVFWKVGSSATLGTASTFVGTILALTSITATTGASVSGRLLARNGAVILDSNAVNNTCTAATPPTSTTTSTTSTTSTTTTSTTSVPTTTTTTGGTSGPTTTAPFGTPTGAFGGGGATPAVPTGGPGGAPPSRRPALPRTGTSSALITLLGLLALGTGITLVAATRHKLAKTPL